MMNLEICLTCLEQPSKTHNLNEVILENLKILDLLHQLVPLLLEKQDLTLPDIICAECLKDLVVAYKFQKKCLDSIQNLHKTFSNSSLNNETSRNESNEFTSCNENPATSLSDEDIKMTFDEVSVESYALTSDTSILFEQNNDRDQEGTSNNRTEKTTKEDHEKSSNDLPKNIETSIAADSSTVCNQCKICKRKFKQPQGLASHMTKTHLKKHFYKCQKCKRGFHAEDPFIRHCNSHLDLKPFSCSECNKSFETNSQLNSHKRCHSKEQTYTCNVCDKKFHRIDAFRMHTKRHDDVKSFNCLKCGKLFNRFSDHYKHLQSHKKEDDEISNKSDLYKDRDNEPEQVTSDPLKTEENEVKTEEIDDVEITFEDAREVPINTKQETRLESKNQQDNTNLSAEIHRCDICKHVCKNYLGLAIHRSTAHFKTYAYQCDQCDKKFNVEDLYIKHRNQHLGIKNFKCNQCDKVFETNGMLNQHLISHSDSTPHLCTICGKGFRYSGNLRQHMRRHGDERPFKCTTCPKAFKCLSDKIKHMLSHDKKRYECKVCGTYLSSSDSLSQHIMIHTGEKPYKCKHCDKSFISLSNWKCHERIHTGEKPYKCEYCQKTFCQSSDRKKHIRRMHKKEMEFEKSKPNELSLENKN